MQGLDPEVDLDNAFSVLTTRLVERYGHRVRADVIQETVAACAAPFKDARIVTFVPVLAERSCRAPLGALADAAPEDEMSEVDQV